MSDEQTQAPEAAPAPVPASRKRTVRTPGVAAQAPEAAPAAAPSDAGLPNAIDIDPRKIEAPVLSKQGWVVPDEEYRTKRRKLAAMQAEIDAAEKG